MSRREPGTLHIVATPIGNMGDMTYRGVETLREAGVIVAEDTRRARGLLTHFGIGKKDVRRLDASASDADVARVVDALVAGEDVALVTDAGTPVVSDPGAKLVAAARAAGRRVVPIPGASAVTALLSVAGFEAKALRFVGFLPRSLVERDLALAEVAASPDATVFFEAPHRMSETLEALARAMPSRGIVIGRELTKLHEEILAGGAREIAEREKTRAWLGELAIAVEPAELDGAPLASESIERLVDEELARGKSVKDVAAIVSLATGASKRDVYEIALARKRARG
jgi:16S rRNA (cytidine1402-2'-O)-methyltransferase